MKYDCFEKFKKWFATASLRDYKKIPSAPFQTNIRFLFEGFNKDISKCKGFKISLRNLLVDNILKTMMFDTSSNFECVKPIDESEKSYQERLKKPKSDESSNSQEAGLPYMLENKFFNDAFLLHEENDDKLFKEMMSNVIKNGLK